jgi:hypothetical protein
MYLDLSFELHDITKVITIKVLVTIMSWFSSHYCYYLVIMQSSLQLIVLTIVLNNHVIQKTELITCYTMFKTCG